MATEQQMEIIQHIAHLALKITTQGAYHVFFKFSGHVKTFEVYAHLSDNDYDQSEHLEGWGFRENHVYLADDENCEQLKAIHCNLSRILEVDADGIPV